jgi:hypothetical protein
VASNFFILWNLVRVCTMGSVGEYFGDSQQADRGIHVCRGGEVRGEPCRPGRQRGEGEGPQLESTQITEGYRGEREGLIRQARAVLEGEFNSREVKIEVMRVT